MTLQRVTHFYIRLKPQDSGKKIGINSVAVNIKTFFLKGRYKNKVKPRAAVWRQVLAVCVIDKRSEPSCTKNPHRSVRTENHGGK